MAPKVRKSTALPEDVSVIGKQVLATVWALDPRDASMLVMGGPQLAGSDAGTHSNLSGIFREAAKDAAEARKVIEANAEAFLAGQLRIFTGTLEPFIEAHPSPLGPEVVAPLGDVTRSGVGQVQ
eukprot:14452197-Alexandrium_andersonii.AAC.1